MTTERLRRRRGEAELKVRHAKTDGERDLWRKFIHAADAELGARAGTAPPGASEARSGPPTPPGERSFGERLAAAHEALYGPHRTRASEEAARLRPEMEEAHRRMGGSLPEDAEAIRDRARRVMAGVPGGVKAAPPPRHRPER